MAKKRTMLGSTPLHNMIHHNDFAPKAEVKTVEEEENKRTTILINPTTYRRFKMYAVETGQTVTALINDFMEDTLANAGK